MNGNLYLRRFRKKDNEIVRRNHFMWMKYYGVNIQMRATEQYFPVVVFFMLSKMVLTFGSVDKIRVSQHSESRVFGDIKKVTVILIGALSLQLLCAIGM